MQKSDKIFIVALVFLIVAHSSTLVIINIYSDTAQTIKEGVQVVKMMEANPVTRYFIFIDNLKYIWSFIILPSVLASVYYYYRKKLKDNQDVLEAYCLMFMCVVFFDMLNDLSILLPIVFK